MTPPATDDGEDDDTTASCFNGKSGGGNGDTQQSTASLTSSMFQGRGSEPHIWPRILPGDKMKCAEGLETVFSEIQLVHQPCSLMLLGRGTTKNILQNLPYSWFCHLVMHDCNSWQFGNPCHTVRSKRATAANQGQFSKVMTATSPFTTDSSPLWPHHRLRDATGYWKWLTCGMAVAGRGRGVVGRCQSHHNRNKALSNFLNKCEMAALGGGI